MNDDLENILAHFGVKGMKWGVRKSRKAPKQGPSDDAKTAFNALVKAKGSGVEALSNRELRALNDRLNLESNFQRLSYNPGKLKKGLDAVQQMLGVGNTVNDAIKFQKSEAGQMLSNSLTKKAARTTTKSTP